MTTYDTVIVERKDGVARVTMTRPESFNLLNSHLLNDLFYSLDEVRLDPAARAVVLTGAGRGFCSGADIGGGPGDSERPVRDPDLGIERYNRVIRTIRAMEKPVIAAVNGAAAGAGFGMALASDFRIASENAKFVTAFARIALSSDSGVAYWLPKIIGHQRATELLFSSRRVLAEEALQIGLVNEVVPADEFEARVNEFATTYAHAATRAIGLTKKILNNSWELPLAAHLDFEAHAQSMTGSSYDFGEGVKAFQEKRDPAFEGR